MGASGEHGFTRVVGRRFPLGAGGRGRASRWPLAALAVALAAVLQPVAGSSAEGPTIEAASSGPYGYAWKPSTAEIGPGGTVSFKSTSAVIPHGVSWRSGPEAPSCTGVPIEDEGTSWSGSCTFAQPGSYAFVCTVHPTEMKGTSTVTEGGSGGPNPPPPGAPQEPPTGGPAARALKLAASQRGAAARGSIVVSQGATLKVALLASRASLRGPGHRGRARVGSLVRRGLAAGRTKFRVRLSRLAAAVLRRGGRIRLRARITVTAPQHDALKLTRGVVLHG
jgi:plastocyanin